DVVLIGHAYNFARATEVWVRLRAGALDKTARVVGDRYWIKTLGLVSMTTPEPFERIPLIYERTFRGWDRRNSSEDKHSFDPRNPVGTGFRSKEGKFEDGVHLPNIEDPQSPIQNYLDMPSPTGFGFTSPNWQPRAGLAGTRDDQWMNQRMPL